jgi:pimeloyl-ACP methyl ester carboxylesterase
MSATSIAPPNSTIVRFPALSLQGLLRAYFAIASRVLPEVAGWHAEQLFTLPPRYAGHQGQPVDARRATITAGRHAIAVWEAGPAASPAVLLVHGWGGRGKQMGAFAAPLLAAGYRVIWFDQPGHGESGRGASSLPDFLRAVEAVVATHGPFAAAIGHSLGAAAIGLALRHGVRLGRVVLVSPPSSIGEHTRRFARLLGITPRVRDAMRRRLEHRFGVRFADIDRIEELAQVRVPALFVHDSDDAEVPVENTLRLSALMPRANMIRTYGLGHYRILREPAVVAAVVDFIRGRTESLPAELPALPRPAPIY